MKVWALLLMLTLIAMITSIADTQLLVRMVDIYWNYNTNDDILGVCVSLQTPYSLG